MDTYDQRYRCFVSDAGYSRNEEVTRDFLLRSKAGVMQKAARLVHKPLFYLYHHDLCNAPGQSSEGRFEGTTHPSRRGNALWTVATARVKAFTRYTLGLIVS
ncbi:hypothetical protein J6590_061615 [Homalodisca vitripennis]|nr:hypothetical protein J6590_061615 [Homalodisca vitripennis]